MQVDGKRLERLEVALSSLGIYSTKYLPAWSGNAPIAEMTESDFRRLEVALSSLGIYYYEVVSPGSPGAGVGR